MNTYKLNADSPNQSIEGLLNLAADGGLAIRNEKGEIVALLLPPADKEAWVYAKAFLEIEKHKEQILQARKRKAGITTTELLKRAHEAVSHESDNRP